MNVREDEDEEELLNSMKALKRVERVVVVIPATQIAQHRDFITKILNVFNYKENRQRFTFLLSKCDDLGEEILTEDEIQRNLPADITSDILPQNCATVGYLDTEDPGTSVKENVEKIKKMILEPDDASSKGIHIKELLARIRLSITVRYDFINDENLHLVMSQIKTQSEVKFHIEKVTSKRIAIFFCLREGSV